MSLLADAINVALDGLLLWGAFRLVRWMVRKMRRRIKRPE
jgi:hypothetical protein